LYNEYADKAGYHDICLQIYHVANYANRTDIIDTWRTLIDSIHTKCETENRLPWEGVANQVRILGGRLNLSNTVFPVNDLLPRLKRYEFEYQRGIGPATWVVDIFIDLGVEYEVIFTALVDMLYNQEAPFTGKNRYAIADDVFYVALRWFQDSSRGPSIVYGSEPNARGVMEQLKTLPQSGLSSNKVSDCQALRARIDQLLR
jgi:nuclear pore complex protein Nup155